MNRLFRLIFCLCLLSCQQQPDDLPTNMVPQQTMVRILADIHTAEALIERNVSYPDTAQVIYAEEHAEILEKYGVEQGAFRETYEYYLTNLEEMDKLYEVVVDTLSVRESLAEAVKAKADSANAVKPTKRIEKTSPAP